jgi:putative ABC transport system substrate-binding protein
LRELGYAEGKNLVLEVRHADASVERLPELARELVGLKMDAIVTITDPAVAAGDQPQDGQDPRAHDVAGRAAARG